MKRKNMKMWAEAYQDKLIQPENLQTKVAELRSQGHKIATLNGSFDLLHAGHLHIIYEASKQADKLIVALNSDSSIRQYKSLHRPVIPLQYRLEMLAALGFVDYVTWFDETDPRRLLSLIKPDVHVNGADYGENCIEAGVVREHGGRLHLVSLVPSLSSTQVIKKILTLPPEGK